MEKSYLDEVKFGVGDMLRDFKVNGWKLDGDDLFYQGFFIFKKNKTPFTINATPFTQGHVDFDVRLEAGGVFWELSDDRFEFTKKKVKLSGKIDRDKGVIYDMITGVITAITDEMEN